MSLSVPVSESRSSSAARLGGEVPVGVRANLAPASVEVVSNLAEDTVIAGAMDIAVGVNKVALFANPFTGGSEEMLYVDEQATLRWARHLNAAAGQAVDGEDVSGWSIAPVMEGVVEVVVAVHPAGGVYAWVLHGDATSRHLTCLELVPDPAVPGGYRWSGGTYLPDMDLAGLSVQYCGDRPATPVVFVTVPSEPRLLWYLPNFSPGPDGAMWHSGGEFGHDPADKNTPVVAGVDDPDEASQPTSAVGVVRLWTVHDDGLWQTIYRPRSPHQPYTRQLTLKGHDALELVGRWTGRYGTGVIAAAGGTSRFVFTVSPTPGSDGWSADTHVLDQPLQDLTVWQDADNLLHLYGRDAHASLVAVHQTGWTQLPDTPMSYAIPVWDTHPDPHDQPVLTTRPLVAKTATYAIDTYPDELPSQHVMHQDTTIDSGELCAIYTQSIRTNFWSTEKIRLVPDTLPAAYPVTRYQTTLTLKDAYGAAMPGIPVSLTADVPIDLEVEGRFYRTGAVTPTTLTTDPRGRITLRVVATGLSVPMMYATTPGLAQSVTIQMAADIHKFLAGDTPLPNHPDGFTPTTITTATTPDGQPLFNKIRKADEPGTLSDQWPPSAEDVITWCQAAFAVDTGTPLPQAMRASVGDDATVHGFALQTHDPTRAGLEVYTHPDQLEARRASITANGGIFDTAEDWWGDVWQGIREGVTTIGEVFVNIADSAIELVITLADGVLAVLTAAWDDILTAAHAVEAAFVAIGAAIDDALTWLQWAFDFTDVINYAKYLDTQLRTLPAKLTPVLDYIEPKLHNFFVNQEAAVHELFTNLKDQILPNRSTGSAQTPLASVPADAVDPVATSAADQASGPHANYLIDKLAGSGSSGLTLQLDEQTNARIDELSDGFLDILTTHTSPHLKAALEDFVDLFANLFKAEDPQTFLALELVTLLDLFEQLIEVFLEFLDAVSHQILEWVRTALDVFIALLDAPLIGIPLLDVIWDYLVTTAGHTTTTFPLTFGNLAAVIAAFPATLVIKIATGKPPITHLHHTDSTTGLTADPKGAVNDMFLGVMTLLEIPPTFAILAGDGLPPTAVYRLLTFVRSYRSIFEIPVAYNTEFPPKHLKAVALWTSWTIDTIWNVADALVFKSTDWPLEHINPVAGGPEAVLVRGAATTAYGLNQLVWDSFAWWPDDPNYYNVTRLVARVFRRMPYATNMVTLHPSTTFVLAAGKILTDPLMFAASGLAQMSFAGIEAANPVRLPAAGPLPPAAAGVAYTSSPIATSGGLPTYRWTALDPLPEGLDLTVSSGYADGGKTATLTGTPPTPGHHSIRLQVTDGFASIPSSDIQTYDLTVYAAPTASFTAAPNQGPAPLVVEFRDTSSGQPTTWLWDFGDGHTSTEQSPDYAYAQPGTYKAALTVTNPAGTSTSPAQIIQVTGP